MKSSVTVIHMPRSLEDIARRFVTQMQFETAKREYESWSESLPAQTSTLNHRLYFLELLERQSGDTGLKDEKEFAEALLENTGVRQVGDQFDRVDANGVTKHWEVIWRKIGGRYGVEMGLKSQDGDLLSGEFCD